MRSLGGEEWAVWLREHGLVGLDGLDTRSLVLRLRDSGAMRAAAVSDECALSVTDALEQGLVQKKVAAARMARERALADKKEALIGASEYPGVADVPVLDVPRVTLADLPAAVACEPLTPVRLAAPFEKKG